MSDDTLRLLITTIPAAGALLVTARYVWQIQRAVTARFEHVLQQLRSDIVTLERANERLEGQLSVERDARRADNARCDAQLAELRRRLAQLTPPGGYPNIGD
jgi:hypothetical protein